MLAAPQPFATPVNAEPPAMLHQEAHARPRGQGYTKSTGTIGALMERRRELGGPVSRWNRR
jgi:hypothetical protein